MTEPRTAYGPRMPLDPGKRYCLVDTMVLLQVYRRDPRLTAMVDIVRGGRDLLLVRDVIDECFSVFQRHKPDTASAEPLYVGDESGEIYEFFDPPVTHEDFRVEPRSRGEFDGLLAESLQRRGIKPVVGLLDQDEIDAAKVVCAGKKYRNKRGVPLSRVDCILLSLAIKNPNFDVITDDAALAEAVLAECGPGRASRALSDYFGRLNMTADFLARALSVNFIDCNPIREYVEYRVRNARAEPSPRTRPGRDGAARKDRSLFCSVQVSPDGISASSGPADRNLSRDGAGDATLALLDFVWLVVMDWYCACGDAGWAEFDKKWSDAEYDHDTMRITGRTNKPYYDIAKNVLEKNRGRYCACSKPDERHMHEEFRTIMSEAD